MSHLQKIMALFHSHFFYIQRYLLEIIVVKSCLFESRKSSFPLLLWLLLLSSYLSLTYLTGPLIFSAWKCSSIFCLTCWVMLVPMNWYSSRITARGCAVRSSYLTSLYSEAGNVAPSLKSSTTDLQVFVTFLDAQTKIPFFSSLELIWNLGSRMRWMIYQVMILEWNDINQWTPSMLDVFLSKEEFHWGEAWWSLWRCVCTIYNF